MKRYTGPLLPADARYVDLCDPEVAVYDVTHILDEAFPRRRAPRRPNGQVIDRLFIHHSGRRGLPGFAGLFASHRYSRTQRKPKPFPIGTYHHWFPWEPLLDAFGRLVVLRAGDPDADRFWHTGGRANDRGEAAAFQGALGSSGPSWAQEKCARAFIPWRFKLRGWSPAKVDEHLSWHARATRDGAPNNKPSCPGRATVAWLQQFSETAQTW